ncbi:DEAD/DEAH box helicase [Corynebacterium sp. MSK151]|uniref:DEAD/DEAH box helicase n=1 Tax=unclassified Corynebacterium TaxID=2624378 RepID=UPI00254B3D2F|nr:MULTISPECIES: DEAD/DEAH box helicase [unclassified Corynebacterium]MDK8758218.1 DEAD/DEAH box helicase [Corynebacterium sp. MSK151]MDK8847239.1 DEAD/DEAH box helicase [Corynebacterium sp. MSK047]
MESFGRELLGPVIRAHPRATVTHIADLPARAGVTAPWPEWVPSWLREVLVDRGIENLWTHQATTANLAREGVHCVVATGTASGKSLGYLLPVLTELSATPAATALYISPTKALGADQLDTARAMAPASLSSLISLYDGDTPQDARRAIRDHARWVFTNPDMLHVSVLGNHVRWTRMLRNLRYIVVDECHAYRGVFGANVSQILRRLLRLSREYGASPTVIFASATTNDPADQARRLIGEPVEAITEDGAPVGERTIALWEPGLLPDLQGENGAPVRRPAPTEAADIMADLLVEGARTLTFTRSRNSAEKVALGVRERLEKRRRSDIAERIESYRAGYLAEERRDIERMLDDGTLLGVATTNALELGIDVGGLDAVVQAGFPGTVASFWQQAGRAGRRGQGALVVLAARDDPMDTYLVHNPSALLGRPVEKTVFDPRNPHVVWSHLYCAAVEKPVTTSQLQAWGTMPVAEDMVAAGWLRKRTWEGQEPVYYPTDRDEGPRIATAHDAVNVRGGDGQEVAIVDQTDGRLLGTIDLGRAMQQVHDGAVYLHRGESYLVDQLDFDSLVALVHPEQPRYSTSSRMDTTIRILDVDDMRHYQGLQVASCQVEVFHQVTSYLRRLDTGEILDSVELDYPPQRLVTRAVAYTMPESTLRSWGVGSDIAPGALHAAEHAAIGMLPLIATCDRWDIGGVSTVMHADTQQPTVFVYDGHPGGAGFADRGYEAFAQWIRATRDAVAACECESGCPSCIQSPKCGNGNDPLDKAGAIKVLSGVSRALNDGQ